MTEWPPRRERRGRHTRDHPAGRHHFTGRIGAGDLPDQTRLAAGISRRGAVAIQDGWELGDGVFGGGAAGAFVDDFVVVAVGVEALLQCVGIGLAGLQAVTGGDAVAEADEEWSGGAKQRGGEENKQD